MTITLVMAGAAARLPQRAGWPGAAAEGEGAPDPGGAGAEGDDDGGAEERAVVEPQPVAAVTASARLRAALRGAARRRRISCAGLATRAGPCRPGCHRAGPAPAHR